MSDVIERGFYDDNELQDGDESRPAASSAKPALSLSLSELQGNAKDIEVRGALLCAVFFCKVVLCGVVVVLRQASMSTTPVLPRRNGF